jgi:ATP-binding cassette subfamily F protein 3
VQAGTANDLAGGNGSGPGEARPKGKAKPKGPSKNRLSDQQKAEKAVEAAEASLKELEGDLADPAAWATRYEAAKSEARHTAAKRAVEDAYARLETLID